MAWPSRSLALVLGAAWLLQASCANHVATFTRYELLESGNALSAYYDSSLFGGQVEVQVSPSMVSLSTYAPSTLVAGLSKGASNVPLSETFQLPANASDMTIINHITVSYNPFGAFPYPTGLKNPLWSANISQSLTCVTCWFYVNFFFVPQSATEEVAKPCATSSTNFCDAKLVPWGKTATPDPAFLPKSFVPATGDFYSSTVVKSTVAGQPLGNLRPLAEPVTPLVASKIGQFWVSKQPPYTFIYNGTRVLAAQNYYLTDNGTVLGVGQVVSRDYFSFFSDFFAHTDPVKGHLVNSTGPFAVPTNYSVAGDYPAGALTEINGFKGTSTFTFGFTNTTSQLAPPTSAAGTLVLNLPWLIASVWIAGAVVLLTEHF